LLPNLRAIVASQQRFSRPTAQDLGVQQLDGADLACGVSMQAAAD
jgi:hypothetical protein